MLLPDHLLQPLLPKTIECDIQRAIDIALSELGYVEPVKLGDVLLVRLFKDNPVTIEHRRVIYREIRERTPQNKIVLGSRKGLN